jgi:16S rRNA (adenine1518-N6/adenine1519-N6)-dimethyltransferase
MVPPIELPALNIRALLRTHNLRPKKGLGQNFLSDPGILDRIVESAQIPPHTTVLEVGPGLGSLTRFLAVATRQVVAVELDANFIPVLHEVLASTDNVAIHQGDILALDPTQLIPDEDYLVVANIPYNITSALIRHLLEAARKPQRIVLTIQQEVAARICAAPGKFSLLALSVQVYGKPSIAMRIPAGAFYPPPKVDSAVLRVDLYAEPRIAHQQLDSFFTLIKAGFSQKRKTLRNALSGGLHWKTTQSEALLNAAHIDPNRRAETLSIEEWGTLTQIYSANP